MRQYLDLLRDVKDNGVDRMEIIDQKKLRELEPNISPDAKGALLAASAGIVCPYELTIAATENAVETDYAAEAGMTVEAEAGEDVAPATGGASAGEDDGSQVTVVGYETMDMEGGGQMDVAVVEVDGLQGVVADIDMDGSADIVAIDANDDGRLGEDEFLDVSGQGIDMASLGGGMQVSGEPLVAEVPASQYDAVDDPQDGSQTGFQADAGGALPDDGQQAGDLQSNILQTDDLQDSYADVAFNDVYEDAPLDYVNDADVGDYMV